MILDTPWKCPRCNQHWQAQNFVNISRFQVIFPIISISSVDSFSHYFQLPMLVTLWTLARCIQHFKGENWYKKHTTFPQILGYTLPEPKVYPNFHLVILGNSDTIYKVAMCNKVSIRHPKFKVKIFYSKKLSAKLKTIQGSLHSLLSQLSGLQFWLSEL